MRESEGPARLYHENRMHSLCMSLCIPIQILTTINKHTEFHILSCFDVKDGPADIKNTLKVDRICSTQLVSEFQSRGI